MHPFLIDLGTTEALVRVVDVLLPQGAPAQPAASTDLNLEILRKIAPPLLRWPDLFREIWEAIQRAVLDGEAEQVQAGGGQFQMVIDGSIKATERILNFSETLSAADKEAAAIQRDLGETVAQLHSLRDSYFSWQTAEDLEDLVAQCYPLSAEKLASLAQSYKPPQSWYDETDKPF